MTLTSDEELVLLTSYFNLAQSRRQDTADTFRVDPHVPSATSPDGTAALYIVTEASAAGHLGPRARRLVADSVAWEYSTRSDEPPAARLKAALRAAHEELRRELDGHVVVGVSVIAVEGDDIYLAQVAPGQVYVLHDGSLHSMPASASGTAPFARGLGSSDGPQIAVFRDEVAAGDVLTLCSSWFHRTADADELRACFGAGTADDIAECMLELAKEHDVREATAIVIEAAMSSDLEGMDGPTSPTFTQQVDDAVSALANVGRMLMTELRPISANGGSAARDSDMDVDDVDPSAEISTSRPIEPAAENHPATDLTEEEFVSSTEPDNGRQDNLTEWDLEPVGPAAEAPAPERDQATEEVPVVSAAPEPVLREVEPIEDMVHDPKPPSEPPGSDAIASRRVEPVERQASELEELNSRLKQDLGDMTDVIPPVQAFPDTSVQPERIYATSKDIQAVNRRPRRFGGVSRADDGAPVIRPPLNDINLRQSVNRPAPPAVVWFSAAAICVFAALALFLFLHHRHTTAATPPYLGYVRSDLRLARAATLPATQDTYLGKARKNMRLAREHGATRSQLAPLQAALLTTTDQLHKVTREAATAPIASFDQPTEIATGPQSLFVLDAGKNAAYSFAPTPTSSPTQIVQSGETDSGFTIGKLTELATSGSTALLLDSNNVLVRDSAGTKTATSLAKASQTQQSTAMANFGPDVYVLDAPGNQIWRYPDAVAGFNPSPTGFLSPNPPDISHGDSFTIDDKNLYVLTTDGKVLKFDNQANQQAFTVGQRANLVHPDAIFTDVGLPYIWIADPGSARIVQLDKATGRYVRAYESGTRSMKLSQVKGIAVPPGGKNLYVLAGKQVFGFPVLP